jgi:hypothetical protein
MPMHGDRLMTLVDDPHRNFIILIPDQVGAWSLSVDEPRFTGGAICVMGPIRELQKSEFMYAEHLT